MILLSCSGCCRKDCITPKAGTHRSSETSAPLKPKYSHRPKRNPHTVRAKFAAFAQEYPTQNNNARYIGISMLNADLSIDDNGKSSCSGNVTLNNSSYSTDLTMELIQVDTGKVMKTWTDSGSISISLTNKPWYVTSGHRYQVKVTVTVYNTSGKSIETSEEVSSIVKF